MSVIVTDRGFAADDWRGPVVPLADWTGPEAAVDIAPGLDDNELRRLAGAAPAMIRIAFASFADGRGFTLARRLRDLGYRGRLRAAGHVIADQYAMARRAGFDEVEIDDALARRQPESQWRARANWRAGDYRARLGATRAEGSHTAA